LGGTLHFAGEASGEGVAATVAGAHLAGIAPAVAAFGDI
jgi:hypothetical protein